MSKPRLIQFITGLIFALDGVGGGYLSGGATASASVIVFYVLLGLLSVAVPGLLSSAALGQPLRVMRETISATRNDGDLTRRIEVTGDREVGPTTTACNDLLSTFHSITTRIVFNAAQVAEMAVGMKEVAGNAEETARIAQQA